MGPNKLKTKTEKIANAMIIGLVVMGTVIFSVMNQASSGTELMPRIFMLFLGAIITVQVIPSLILLGKVITGVASLSQKKQEPAKVTARSNDGK